MEIGQTIDLDLANVWELKVAPEEDWRSWCEVRGDGGNGEVAVTDGGRTRHRRHAQEMQRGPMERLVESRGRDG